MKKRFKKFSLLMGLIILFMSCSQYGYDNQLNNDSDKIMSYRSNVKTTDIFKGVFFNFGPIADLIPEIKNSHSYYSLKQLEVDGLNEQYDIIIEKIEENTPEYFSKFREQITSGNHLIINDVLKEGVDQIYKALVDVYFDGKTEFFEILEQIEPSLYLNEDGTIDYEILKQEIERISDSPELVSPMIIGVIFVIGVYILLAHGAFVMTYVGVAWAAGFYAAVHNQAAITSGGVSTPGKTIRYELLVQDIATYLHFIRV